MKDSVLNISNKMSIFYFIILSLNIIIIIQAQTTNPNDIGKCNCDLTLGHCDINCCCDNDCSQADLDVFTCSQNTNDITNQWCIPNSALFLSNTPYIITTLGDLVCVDVNNTLSLNYYLAPLTDSIVIKDTFITLVANSIAPPSVKHSFDLPSSDNPFNRDNYVYAILQSNFLSVLSLPIQVGSACRSGPPVYHYQDKTTNCLVSPQDLKDECSKAKTSSLSLKYFLNGPKFIRKPKSLENCLENAGPVANPFDYYNNCNENYLKQLEIRSCTDENGLQIDLNDCENKLEPSLNNDLCTNLVKSVSYIFRFNSATGIVQAGLDVVFKNEININTNTKFFEQMFEVVFVPDSISFVNFDSINSLKLSGNPGYLRRKPIVVGSTAQPSDRSNKLTYFMPSSQGMCQNDDSSRANVKFQENIITECFFRPTPTLDPSSSNFCKLVQDAIDEFILGTEKDKRAIRFSPFATSDPSNWTEIINSGSQPEISNVNGVCKSVRIGATIQIAYALVGNVANPQSELQYISYDWNEKIDIIITCQPGQFCIDINNLMIKVSTRVIFVDVSQPPLYAESQMARPQTTLPGDFFYPIINSSVRVIILNYWLFFFVLLTLF